MKKFAIALFLLLVLILGGIFVFVTYQTKKYPAYVPGEVILALKEESSLEDFDSYIKNYPEVTYRQGYTPNSFFKASLKPYNEWQQKVKNRQQDPNLTYQREKEIREGKNQLEQIYGLIKSESIITNSEVKEYYDDFPFIRADLREGTRKPQLLVILEKYPQLELFDYYQGYITLTLKVKPGEEDLWINLLSKEKFTKYTEKNYIAYPVKI